MTSQTTHQKLLFIVIVCLCCVNLDGAHAAEECKDDWGNNSHFKLEPVSMYEFTDEKGVHHFRNTPAPGYALIPTLKPNRDPAEKKLNKSQPKSRDRNIEALMIENALNMDAPAQKGKGYHAKCWTKGWLVICNLVFEVKLSDEHRMRNIHYIQAVTGGMASRAAQDENRSDFLFNGTTADGQMPICSYHYDKYRDIITME